MLPLFSNTETVEKKKKSGKARLAFWSYPADGQSQPSLSMHDAVA
jgi:hypothetical protein